MGTDLKINVEDTALLVIDAQNAWLHPEGTLGLSGVNMTLLTSIVAPLRRLIQACKACGIPDIWTVQVNFDVDRARALHRITHHTLKRARVACLRGSWDAEIVEELKPLLDARSHVIEKHRFSAFYGTRLEVLLRMLGRNTLLICGATTNACVDSTVRDAYMRDYDVIIVRDCVGGVNREWHEVAISVWQQYFGFVGSLDQVLSLLPVPQLPPDNGTLQK
jgi:ureidoacrylate peracid hydrolase